MGEIITKADLGRHLGLNNRNTRVSKWVADGMPTLPNGKLNREDALEWIRQNVSPQGGRYGDRGVHAALAASGPAPRPSGPGGGALPPDGKKAVRKATRARGMDEDDEPMPRTFAEAKILRESYLGKKARLDYLSAAGKLLDAATTESRWARIFTDTRNRILSCSGRIGARIPHLTSVEIAVIDRELRNALEELSRDG